MAKTDTARELLIVALQDLADAERAMEQRVCSFEAQVSPDLAAHFRAEREQAASQVTVLHGLLDALEASPSGAPNIWLRAALDDAARDYETIVPGSLRDIALVGAFRKAAQASRVSYETAVGLARALGKPDFETRLQALRDDEAAADQALSTLLEDLLARITTRDPAPATESP
jgi:ferritin-like metal-binding protein YciE